MILAITLSALTIVIGVFVIGYAIGDDGGSGVVATSSDANPTPTAAPTSVDEPASVPPTDDAEGDPAAEEHADAPGEHDEAGEPDPAVADTDDTVVQVTMTEFGYELSRNELPVGIPIVFEFENVGAIEHEAMIGTAHMQEEFADMATGADGHDHGDAHHGDIDAITLGPGEDGSLTVTFDEPGEWLLGCHLPGHWDAGMTATMQVS